MSRRWIGQLRGSKSGASAIGCSFIAEPRRENDWRRGLKSLPLSYVDRNEPTTNGYCLGPEAVLKVLGLSDERNRPGQEGPPASNIKNALLSAGEMKARLG